MDFNVFVPVTDVDVVNKSEKHAHNYVISGLASTPDVDFDGETILPEGMNIDYLINNGWIDYEHDIDNIVGYPLREGTYVDNDGLHLKAVLFSDNKDVQRFVQLYKNIVNDNADRKLGFSIEGQVLERDTFDDSIINSINIHGVAITTRPCNEHATISTWEELAKSIKHSKIKKNTLTADSETTPSKKGSGGSLRNSGFIADATRIAEYFDNLHRNGVDIEDVAVSIAGDIQGNPKLKNNKTLAKIFVQLFSGVSEKAAIQLLGDMDYSDTKMQQDLDNAASDLD